MTAVPCAFPSCGNTTTDPAGVCHAHRKTMSTMRRRMRVTPPPPPSSPEQETRASAVLTGIPETDATEIRTRSTNGDSPKLLVEERIRVSDGKLHREDGGPAYVSTDPDGTLVAEMYALDGAPHRLDGPAKIDYDRLGEVEEQEFFYRGRKRSDRVEVIEEFVSAYRAGLSFGRFLRGSDPRIRFHRMLAASSFRTLLEEGRGVDEIVDLLGEGVTTVDGMREVFAGAPVEWVRSYERGGSA